MLIAACLALCLAPGPASAQAGVPEEPDVSQCDNCDDFPEELLKVGKDDLIDLEALPAERRLDFLVGEWELIFPAHIPEEEIHYTVDQPVGYEIFDWFVRDKVLHGFQEWPFTNQGRVPFRAKTDFRYVADEDRWQMTWMTGRAVSLFTGGLEAGGVIALYEHTPTGGRGELGFEKGMRYVLRNITRDTFIAEEYQSSDGGSTFDVLKWRLLYRRRDGV